MNLYPLDTLEQFEFKKIQQLIANHCRCAASREMVQLLAPVGHVDTLLLLLNQTQEYKSILDNRMYFPDSTYTDISAEIGLLRMGGSALTEEQFGNLRYISDIMNTITKFLNERSKQYPSLSIIIKDIKITTEIIDAINEIIDPKGEVKSSASKVLGELRSDLSAKRKEADKRFRNFVNDLKRLGWLRDNEENFYNGRRVLSVLAEHKRDVKGLVHGSSDTGKTTFIEPFNTIEINNDIVELEQDEKKEVYRLLRLLTDKLRPHYQLIKNYQIALTVIDFTRAKALFAIDINGNLPQIEKQPVIKLINAVHPLLFLQNKQALKNTVPLTLDMNAGNRMIIISGPNAGGKSITLKTIGLLQIMLQSGLLVSANEHSVMSIFHHLFSDIGDSQSIEAELSTYSGRLIKMKHILENANRRTLVLIDEFGTGSDPELGGAIAEVMLEELSKKKSFGIITTHYTNIKLLAENLHGVSNASMLFDPDTLLPKYKLLLGQPGSSYTFEVAEKIGLPPEILIRAGKKVQREKLSLNSMLSELQRDKNKLEQQLKQYEIKEKAAEMAAKKFDNLSDKLNHKLDMERDRMEEQTKLAELGRKLNILSIDWDKNPQKKEVIGKFVSLMTAEKKKRAEKVAEEKREKKKEKTLEKKKATLLLGTEVRLLDSKQTGFIEEIIKNKARVTFGSIKSLVSLENLEAV